MNSQDSLDTSLASTVFTAQQNSIRVDPLTEKEATQCSSSSSAAAVADAAAAIVQQNNATESHNTMGVCNEQQQQQQQRDELLISLAADFKRYFFESWRQELRAQRSTSLSPSVAQTLLLGKVNELQRHQWTLETNLSEISQSMAQKCVGDEQTLTSLYACVEQLVQQYELLNNRVALLESGFDKLSQLNLPET